MSLVDRRESVPDCPGLHPTISYSVTHLDDHSGDDPAAFCSSIRALAGIVHRALHHCSPETLMHAAALAQHLDAQLQRLQQTQRLRFAEVGRWLDALRRVIETRATE